MSGGVLIIILGVASLVNYLITTHQRKESVLVNEMITKVEYETKTYHNRRIIKKVCHSIEDNRRLPTGVLMTMSIPKDDSKFYDIFYNEIQVVRKKTKNKTKLKELRSLDYSIIDHSNYLFDLKNKENNN